MRSLSTRKSNDPSVYVEFPVESRHGPASARHLRSASSGRPRPGRSRPTWPSRSTPTCEYAFVDYTRAGNRRDRRRRRRISWTASSRTAPASVRTRSSRSARAATWSAWNRHLVQRTGSTRSLFRRRPTGTIAATGPRLSARQPRPTAPAWSTPPPATARKTTSPASTTACEVYSPVLPNGRFDQTAPEWIQGKVVWEGQPADHREAPRARRAVRHQADHATATRTTGGARRRSIFRATEQWFIAMDKPFTPGGSRPRRRRLRQRAASRRARSRGRVRPRLGPHRMLGMLESRPDWCISPPAGLGPADPGLLQRTGRAPAHAGQSCAPSAKRFGEKGSDAWFTDSPAELLGPDFATRRASGRTSCARRRTSSTSGSSPAAPGTPCCRAAIT